MAKIELAAMTPTWQTNIRNKEPSEVLTMLDEVRARALQTHGPELASEVTGHFWRELPFDKRREVVSYMRDMEHALR